jgi:hypothetical protein
VTRIRGFLRLVALLAGSGRDPTRHGDLTPRPTWPTGLIGQNSTLGINPGLGRPVMPGP